MPGALTRVCLVKCVDFPLLVGGKFGLYQNDAEGDNVTEV